MLLQGSTKKAPLAKELSAQLTEDLSAEQLCADYVFLQVTFSKSPASAEAPSRRWMAKIRLKLSRNYVATDKRQAMYQN